MKAVAAGDEVADELLLPAGMPEPDLRRLAGEIVDADIGSLEQDPPAVGEPACDEVLHHLLLAVDGDALADQVAEIDVVQGAVEGEMNAMVKHSLALHARAHAGLDQEVARPLLDQAGADAALDVIAAAVFQDDELDARKVQEMRQHQPGRPRPYDPDLYAHACCSRGDYADRHP